MLVNDVLNYSCLFSFCKLRIFPVSTVIMDLLVILIFMSGYLPVFTLCFDSHSCFQFPILVQESLENE